jgi:hypothetical protein
MNFLEAINPKPFVSDSLTNFPNPTDLLILADALEEERDPLGPILRDLVSSRDRDYIYSNHINDARKELKNIGIVFGNESVATADGTEYEWHGKVVAIKSKSGSPNRRIVSIDDINDPNILKGLAVLAANLLIQSRDNRFGLEDYKTTKGNLSRQGKSQLSVESELRYSIKSFLIHFGQFEEFVRRIDRLRRPRHDDIIHVERLINYRNYGYLWQVQLTTEILSQYVQHNGTSPFLTRLSARIFSALNMIPRQVDADIRMVADLRALAELIRAK